jgi:hypothetical protein
MRTELETEPFVMDPQIPVAAMCDRVGSHRLHFLRDHPDIDLVAAVITKTVVEPAEQHDILLEVDVRAAPTTTTAAASTKSSASAETSATAKCRGPVPTAGRTEGGSCPD